MLPGEHKSNTGQPMQGLVTVWIRRLIRRPSDRNFSPRFTRVSTTVSMSWILYPLRLSSALRTSTSPSASLNTSIMLASILPLVSYSAASYLTHTLSFLPSRLVDFINLLCTSSLSMLSICLLSILVYLRKSIFFIGARLMSVHNSVSSSLSFSYLALTSS